MAKKEEIDEDLENFLEVFEKIVKRVSKHESGIDKDKMSREKVNIFFNAYNQYQLAKSTKLLFWATMILAVASILQLIFFVYGPATATSAIQLVVQIVVVILFLTITAAILESVFNLFSKFFGWIKKKCTRKREAT